MKIAVLGTGKYGLAIAYMLSKNNNDIVMYSSKKDKIEEYNTTHNLKSVLDFDIPNNISLCSSIEDTIKDSSIIFLTCTSKYVDSTTMEIKDFYNKNIPICIASKGIDEERLILLSELVKHNLNTKNIAIISGPTFAIDMVKDNPVALAVASYNNKTQDIVVKVLSSDVMKLRKSKDIIGTQICGSVKNIIAIASGILSGLGYSESTTAFLINESLHDVKYLIKMIGGKSKTILSFAGIGDLLMTSMSKKSRNYSFGYVIGSNGNVQEYLTNNTVEGYTTLKSIIKLLKLKNIRIPLICLINDIVDGKENPNELAKFLISKK